MKNTFTTVDVLAIVAELNKNVVGMRVVQIYDIDSKTYLIKLQKPDHKSVLLIESGCRIHTTEYEWPKSPAPSGFAMKLRKHLRNKRIEAVTQLGIDRIIDLQFGIGDAEHHLIVEIYDRGNIILTDSTYDILNLVRPRKDGEDLRLVVHERYPIENCRNVRAPLTQEEVTQALENAKENTPVKKIFMPLLDCGGGVLDHELREHGIPNSTKLSKDFKTPENIVNLHGALSKAQTLVAEWGKRPCEGFIVKKLEKRKKVDGADEEVSIYQSFMPMLFSQHASDPVDKFTSFNQACDEYFSKMEAAKIDQHALQHEKEALKKLEKVKLDHERRLQELEDRQRTHEVQGHLIEINKELVDAAIKVVRTLVANQIDWRQIHELLSEAQGQGDPVALAIKKLKLEESMMTLLLSDPFDCDEDDMLLDSDEEREEGRDETKMRPMLVDIDLEHSAMANARRYFNQKRQAAQKEQKTIDATKKVVQVTTRKTNQALKESAAISNIIKARKVLWFEKFLWFVTSENYLVIAGRDMQMNELLVKRHLKSYDVYVHADMHGAPSVVIKNPTHSDANPLPPKTLHEAGIMALCYSKAWDEKVVTSAWWVWGHQVSKTAPAGEYLTTGSFMVRGKKNFLPPSHLVYGFGFLFRLEQDSIARHAGERKVRMLEEDKEEIEIKEEKEEIEMKEEKEIEVKEESNSDLKKEEENEKEEEDEKEGEEEEEKEGEEEEKEKEDENEEEKDKEEEKEEEEEDAQFPDTKVEMTHIGGDTFSIRTKTFSTSSQVSATSGGDEEEEEEKIVVYLGDDKPVTVRRRKESASKSKNKKGDKAGNKGKGGDKGGNKGKTDDNDGDKAENKEKNEDKAENRDKIGDNDENKAGNNEIKGNKAGKTQKINETGKNKEKIDEVGKNNKQGGKNNKGMEEEENNSKGTQLKRGQKGKNKKIKKKYQDQDEEERQLRMQLLQSAGSNKETKKDAKKNQQTKKLAKLQPKINQPKSTVTKSTVIHISEAASRPKEEEEEEEEDDEVNVGDDLNLVNSLTAMPMTEDEILYAIPVCAPYPTMTNYRFKVKLIPGPTKKGKATKTALALFLADKTISSREKDLLRAVRDQDLSRNLPGKAKVSAPNITKLRK